MPGVLGAMPRAVDNRSTYLSCSRRSCLAFSCGLRRKVDTKICRFCWFYFENGRGKNQTNNVHAKPARDTERNRKTKRDRDECLCS